MYFELKLDLVMGVDIREEIDACYMSSVPTTRRAMLYIPSSPAGRKSSFIRCEIAFLD